MNTIGKPARVSAFSRRDFFGWLLCVSPLACLVAARAAAEDAIKRQPLDSSVLASAGYDAKTRVLEIEFHSGAIYRYLEVPVEIFRSLLAAESKGRFFGGNIRDQFRSARVKLRNTK